MATINKLINLTSGKITLDGVTVPPNGSVNVSRVTNKMLLAKQQKLIDIITTEVAGGVGAVSSVAGRTGAVVLTVADVSGAAPLNSPALAGIATAPTAVPSANNTQIATTAFVKAAIAASGGGSGSDPGITIAYIPVSSIPNVVLLDGDYAHDILVLTGALTLDVTVTVPSILNSFVLVNATTGAFNVAVKTEFGPGIAIAQGYESDVYSDGTTLQYARTFYKDTKLVGLPTAPTPDLANSSDRIATTKFIKDQAYITAEEAPVQTVFGRTGDVVLEPEDIDPFLQDFSFDGGTY
jgi:hypothetical protein